MNNAVKAVIALGMGIGLAGGAQAHGTMHHAKAMSQRSVQMSQQQPQTKLSRQELKTAQQQLKADGLYKGKVDGKFGSKTRMAVARFQQRNGLPRTATLDRQTFNRLAGNKEVGVGSSQPKSSSMTLNNNANANGNGDTNNNAATPMVPPATNPTDTGAGNTGTTNQNPTSNKY